MKKLNKGLLTYNVKAKLNSDGLALRFVADQQKKIDEYERVTDDLFVLLRDPNHKVLLYFDDAKVRDIFAKIRELQKAKN